MSTASRLSLIGMYNYMPTLFDELTLPDGYDKDTFINSLLLEHGEKCVMYSDPDFMRDAIGVWCKKWDLELTKIYEALTAKYDPIFNYDRYENIEDGRTKQYTSKVVGSRKATDKPNYSDNVAHNSTNNIIMNGTETVIASDTNEHTVSADNSSAYQADSKDLIVNNDQTTTNSTDNQTVNGSNNRHVQGTTQDLNETTGTDTSDNENETNKHTAHIYGNIGVTTSAQMVSEVIRQRFSINLYVTATRLFANELLIGIY